MLLMDTGVEYDHYKDQWLEVEDERPSYREKTQKYSARLVWFSA